MTVRTFKQYGQGFGVEPVGIIAKINGTVVFEGTVEAINEPVSSLFGENKEFNNVLFSWENTVDFSGTSDLEIVVTGPGAIVLSKTVANYVSDIDIYPGPDSFSGFYHFTENDIKIFDPLSDPKIDGGDVSRPRELDSNAPLTGQWHYAVMSDSTFTATVNIFAGVEPLTV
jgi:hypothetical protein